MDGCDGLVAFADRSGPCLTERWCHVWCTKLAALEGRCPGGWWDCFAAAAPVLAVLASLAPGYLVWLLLAVMAVAAGLVGYATAPDLQVLSVPALPVPSKKNH